VIRAFFVYYFSVEYTVLQANLLDGIE